MELEGERRALLELEIVDVRLRRYLDVVLFDDLLVGLAHDRFDRLVADRFSELLAHNGRRGLAGPEAGQPCLGGIAFGGALFSRGHFRGWNCHFNGALDAGGGLGVELYLHRWNITVAGAYPVASVRCHPSRHLPVATNGSDTPTNTPPSGLGWSVAQRATAAITPRRPL